MTERNKQREATRAKILEAALTVFSDRGFSAAGTREIADQAGVNQGLITYYFKTKERLWREAASRIFSEARESVVEQTLRGAPADLRALQRNRVKAYVRFVARRPQLLRFMVEEGKRPNARVRWLVDTHLKPLYEMFSISPSHDEHMKPHLFYVMTGAGSLIFAVGPVCKRLTGLDPLTHDAIESHAELVAGLLVP